ncbi:dual specificity testis-specific protein kinase 2-like [Oncorhynchus mykiss]|uniref:dual specificity testis-specific protein kinase 2-like n=1 Tax=Oncorhynchus mykiss TaxID=8022 RepID=UPI00187813D5|nr:dual specificity testis-specific protein kinase 2-like [Oncorhynchus mykiss]XP_036789862.1 dual specificity testis-specific protein kinase 2-like [Oncorhynchus mykiss]
MMVFHAALFSNPLRPTKTSLRSLLISASESNRLCGLDVENLVGDCPTPFLNLAVFCCNMNSKLRLSFSEIVVLLEGMEIGEEEAHPSG